MFNVTKWCDHPPPPPHKKKKKTPYNCWDWAWDSCEQAHNFANRSKLGYDIISLVPKWNSLRKYKNHMDYSLFNSKSKNKTKHVTERPAMKDHPRQQGAWNRGQVLVGGVSRVCKTQSKLGWSLKTAASSQNWGWSLKTGVFAQNLEWSLKTGVLAQNWGGHWELVLSLKTRVVTQNWGFFVLFFVLLRAGFNQKPFY